MSGPNTIKLANGDTVHVGGTPESGDHGSYTQSGLHGHRSHKQYAAVVDLLCHGEIEGVVGAEAGIFLNGTPMSSKDVSQKSASRTIRAHNSPTRPAAYTGHNTRLSFRDETGAMSGDRYKGRHVVIRKGLGKHQTSAVMNVGDKFLPTTVLDGTGTNSGQARRKHIRACLNLSIPLRVEIVHSTGNMFFHIKSLPERTDNNPGGIELVMPPTGVEKSVPSGSYFYIDWGGKTFDHSTDYKDLYFESVLSTNDIMPTNPDHGSTYWDSDPDAAGLATIRFTPVQNGAASFQGLKNFPDSFVEFKRGTRYQQGQTGENLAPTASFTKTSGSGLGVNMHMYDGIPNHDGNVLAAPGQDITITQGSAVTINASEFDFGQSSASEIDSLDVDIEFPGGLYAVSESGGHYEVWVEHQIIFRYKNVSSGGEYVDHLMVGGNYGDYGSSFTGKFVNELNTTSGKMRFRTDLKPRDKFNELTRAGSGTYRKTDS